MDRSMVACLVDEMACSMAALWAVELAVEMDDWTAEHWAFDWADLKVASTAEW